jgi:hypothetical protein
VQIVGCGIHFPSPSSVRRLNPGADRSLFNTSIIVIQVSLAVNR